VTIPGAVLEQAVQELSEAIGPFPAAQLVQTVALQIEQFSPQATQTLSVNYSLVAQSAANKVTAQELSAAIKKLTPQPAKVHSFATVQVVHKAAQATQLPLETINPALHVVQAVAEQASQLDPHLEQPPAVAL
jgi:hypothetical protein